MKTLENNNFKSSINHTSLPKLPNTKKHQLDPSSTPEYLNTQQAADYLGVSHQFLEISRCKGGGPPFIKLSRLVRYKKCDLDEWMNKHRQFNTLGSKVGVEK